MGGRLIGRHLMDRHQIGIS
jgi:hypothetical protein